MKLNFCTLFNSNYLSRGVVMYESLLKHAADFHLYIVAADDACYGYFKSRKDKHVTVISFKEFEDDDLLRVKPTRSAAEYFWTCSSSSILYSIRKYGLENCTYIDADMQFFSDPHVLFEEMGDNSVLITKHRYTREYDQSAISGNYCVQFMSFKNDERGMKVLQSWRDACIDWCYNRVEDGKFGDQKYLDEWQSRFEGVHVLRHLGGGLAPWNVQQYTFKREGERVRGTEKSSGKYFQVVFFHFHSLKFFVDEIVLLSDIQYMLTEEVRTVFYKPYVLALNKAKKTIQEAGNSFDPHGAAGKAPPIPVGLFSFIKYYFYDLKISGKNIFGQKLRNRITHHYNYKTEGFNS